MLKIAITGNIASGKSIVEKFLRESGYAVFDTDNMAHKIVAASEEVKCTFKNYDILSDGIVDRKKLANVVFSDKKELKKLENIVHPLVKREIEKLKEGITEREINKAKKKLKSQFACEVETVSDIGETIGYYMTVCDDLALAEQYIPICESITEADLIAAAKKYLDLNHAAISVLRPQG